MDDIIKSFDETEAYTRGLNDAKIFNLFFFNFNEDLTKRLSPFLYFIIFSTLPLLNIIPLNIIKIPYDFIFIRVSV